MSDPDALLVWYGDRLVGRLFRDRTNRMGFRYGEEWLRSAGFAVSVSLPLTDEPYAPGEAIAHRFFANLLPEGEARSRVVLALKIADSDFDLLRAIGGECAGALSLLPEGREPTGTAVYTELSPAELADLVRQRGRIQAPVTEGGADDSAARPRLSLAGAQDKSPVLMRDGRIHVPAGEAPSSHILKFQIPGYRHAPAYEAVMTELARRIGLPACTVDYQVLDTGDRSHDYLIVERFDRVPTQSGGIVRLHQEDFCQAFGLGPERKYEEDGGADFAGCVRLVREVSAEPALDVVQLLRWQIFNFLAGNSDGHSKNLALLYGADGALRLAPFYDLVCTRAIAGIDERLAFAIGSERRPDTVRWEHWSRSASELDIRAAYLRRLVREAAQQIHAELPLVVEAFQERHGSYPALQRIVRVVKRQCERTLSEQEASS